jgi:hypothetical protein
MARKASNQQYNHIMRRLAVALIELAKSVVVRPVRPTNLTTRRLHWTKFDKPLVDMSQSERMAATERLADEMLEVIKDQKK